MHWLRNQQQETASWDGDLDHEFSFGFRWWIRPIHYLQVSHAYSHAVHNHQIVCSNVLWDAAAASPRQGSLLHRPSPFLQQCDNVLFTLAAFTCTLLVENNTHSCGVAMSVLLYQSMCFFAGYLQTSLRGCHRVAIQRQTGDALTGTRVSFGG
jgi:hypothetical protein